MLSKTFYHLKLTLFILAEFYFRNINLKKNSIGLLRLSNGSLVPKRCICFFKTYVFNKQTLSLQVCLALRLSDKM